MKAVSRYALWIMGLLIIGMAWGCAPKIIPKASQTGQIEADSNIITKEKEGIRVSIQTQEWSFEPYVLEDYVTPFLFLIKNDTAHKVSLKLPDFILFDDQGNQFNALPSDQVESILMTRGLYGRGSYPSLYFRYEDQHPPYTVGFEYPAYYRPPISNITLLSLPEGEIHSKSQVRGFVYFRKATTYGKDLRLKVQVDGFDQDFEFEVKK